MSLLAGKVAIVTGAGNGLGREYALALAANGARVLVNDVGASVTGEASGKRSADAVAAEIRSLGGEAATNHSSVADWAGAERIVADAVARFGRLDVVVNNAGIIVFKRLDDLSEDEIRRVIDINLIGTMLGAQLAIPALERAGGGSITNMSSADGISGANSLTAYCASKFGVRGFTKALALELGPRGIRVNSIHPGGILTPMANPTNIPRELYDRGYWIYPAQKSGDPADIGAAAAYLASDDAKYCIGTELSVDGGLNAGHYYMAMPGAPKDPSKA
ncbi:MAG: SDR family oxidoreductase [Sphingomonadaceae bacterium]|nr:SDR family oxidoreductase [Sphingomonadaceae bacterium]